MPICIFVLRGATSAVITRRSVRTVAPPCRAPLHPFERGRGNQGLFVPVHRLKDAQLFARSFKNKIFFHTWARGAKQKKKMEGAWRDAQKGPPRMHADAARGSRSALANNHQRRRAEGEAKKATTSCASHPTINSVSRFREKCTKKGPETRVDALRPARGRGMPAQHSMQPK